MPLLSTLNTLNISLAESKQLAADAHIWASTDWIQLNQKLNQIKNLAKEAIKTPESWTSTNWASFNLPPDIKSFTPKHKEIITQFSFFQTFLSWELFLEESFIDYLMGESPPRGMPISLVISYLPSSRDDARTWTVPHGKLYADWTKADKVIKNAKRFFASGKPYTVLTSQQGTLEEIKIIRNAVAHSSTFSQNEFKKLVRRKLGRYPTGLTKGGFLAMTMPNSSPPSSFFEFYVGTLDYLANQIVPN